MFTRRCFRPAQLPVFHYPCLSRKCISQAAMLQPRQFPSSGFQVIDPSDKVEEEKLPFYHREDYYPMRIGQVLRDRYQVVAKLGYGTSSTVWLCRDLEQQKYWTLKVHVNTLKHNQEFRVLQHVSDLDVDHPGRQHIRQLEDSFKLKGPHGEHEVFIMKPLGMSLRTLQDLQKTKVFDSTLVRNALQQVLLGLNFLHDSEVIHTDLHSDNLLIAITDDSILKAVEEHAINTPVARKQDTDRTIYVSQYMLGGAGPLTICDLGQARIGATHSGVAMPTPYRAPEIVLKMPWGNAVDIWSVGLLAWGLLEREGLFRVYDQEDQELNDAHHLASMTALLGPPPSEFLKRGEETKKYWNEKGQWHGPVPLPAETRLESMTSSLSGADKKAFFHFLKCVLTWEPEERLCAIGAWAHPWVSGKGSVEALEAMAAAET